MTELVSLQFMSCTTKSQLQSYITNGPLSALLTYPGIYWQYSQFDPKAQHRGGHLKL